MMVDFEDTVHALKRLLFHHAMKTREEENTGASMHAIQMIIFSRQPMMVLLRYLCLTLLVILGLASLRLEIQSLFPPTLYVKDLLQEYLMAKAVTHRVNPYLPLPELAKQFMMDLPVSILPHPTPHPPPVIFLGLPLVLIPYEQASIAWFLLEIACIFVVAYLLLRWVAKEASPLWIGVIASLLFGWWPFLEELIYGQLMILLLVLLVGAWHFLRIDKDVEGGILLGIVIALKLVAWPIVVFMILQKKWRTVIASFFVGAFANFVVAFLIGLDKVVEYYLNIGVSVLPFYRSFAYNFSLWTVGWRLFQGTGSVVLGGLESSPIIYLPKVASYVSFVLPMALVVVGLILANRAKTFDAAFGILVCVSVLVSPVTWIHYFTWLIIPIVVLGQRLFSLELPAEYTLESVLVIVLLRLSWRDLCQIVCWFAGIQPVMDTTVTVPLAAGLLTYIPTLATLGLMWLLWRVDRIGHGVHVLQTCNTGDDVARTC